MNKTVIKSAFLIGLVSTVSMTFFFNNSSGTNNEVAAKGGLVTAGVFIAAKLLKVI